MPLSTIKKRSDFLSASARGKRFITHSFILQMQPRLNAAENLQAPRFGFTVTKKMGNAVTRNRIKRRLREAVRKAALAHARDGYDYVIISRQQALECPFSDLLRDMEFAFSRIPGMKDNQPRKPKV